MNMIVTKGERPKIIARKMTEEQMQQDFNYKMAQKCTSALLEKGLISEKEFKKITVLNRESFSPYLVELMDK
ncbi:MAG: hypothetical protein RSE61_05440 [Anaerovoracaceae bacterium]